MRTAVRAAMEEARGRRRQARRPRRPHRGRRRAGDRRPRRRPLVALDRTGLHHLARRPARAARGPRGGHGPRVPDAGRGEGGTVAVRALADESAAPGRRARGLRRLLLLDVGLATGRITSRWTGTQALTLAASPYPSTDALVTDVQLAAIDRLLGGTARGPRRRHLRARCARTVRDRLEDTVHAIVGDLVAVLTAGRELDAEIRARSSLALLATAQDIRSQAPRLVHDGFVSEVGADRLPHLTRYLRAARHRLVKAADNPQRDADLAWQVQDVEALYDDAVAKRPRDPEVEEVRWQLEELRVSLFAQQLGTPVPSRPPASRRRSPRY